MKQRIALSFALLLSFAVNAQQPSAITARLLSGQPVKVMFDATGGKFQDTDRMSGTNPMGTLKGGENYRVVYNGAAGWAVTGYNKGTGGVGTWTYQPGRPEDHDLDLWGRMFKFSDNGEVFDFQYGLVGHVVADGTQPVRPQLSESEAKPIQQAKPGTIGNLVSGTSWMSTATALRGKNNQRFSYACPGGSGPAGSVWGTDIYTDDSTVCLAAVHAGLITPGSGGVVGFEIRPGESAYRGSTRNGVRSSDYGKFSGSFVFVTAH